MIILKKTCGACPEQYDAFLDEKKVGYIRLRHGHFTVESPDCGGTQIYSASPKGDGCFDSDERDYYLRFAVQAIQLHLRCEKKPAPEVEYEIINP